MNRKILVFSFIILVMSIFVASEAFAECRSGFTEVTIVNPAGKVITICVPDNVVGQIGGDGEIVIPATCPCFTQEDVEAAFATYNDLICELYNGTTSITGEPCTIVDCFSDIFYLYASEGNEDEACNFSRCDPTDPTCHPSTTLVNPNACGYEPLDIYPITEEEADACVAILGTFVQ